MIDREKNRKARIIVKYVKSFSTPRLDLYIDAVPPKAVPRPPLLDCSKIKIINESDTITWKINKIDFI